MSLFELSPAARSLGTAVTLLGAAGFVFFTFSRNAPLKRRVWPAFNLLVGGLMLAISTQMDLPRSWVYGFVPILALIVFLTVRSTRFCDACGKTLRHQRILRPSASCPRCGAPLLSGIEAGARPVRIPRPTPRP